VPILPQEDLGARPVAGARGGGALHAVRQRRPREAVVALRVAQIRDARLDALSDPSSFAGLDENDPRSMPDS